MERIELNNINSTNIYAREIAKNNNKNTIIISEEQTAGRGTKGKSWYSDKDSIICSFLIFPKNIKNININFSYDIGLLISNSLNKLLNIKTYIKEPNDIYLDNKKLSGILVETEYCKNILNYIIIGIGINVNQTKFPQDISDIATSLYISSGKKNDKNNIIDMLIKTIEDKNI